MIGLFCRISCLLKGCFAKETYDFKEHTNRSHPIGGGVQSSSASWMINSTRSCVIYMTDMGWLRLVGSFKL